MNVLFDLNSLLTTDYSPLTITYADLHTSLSFDDLLSITL